MGCLMSQVLSCDVGLKMKSIRIKYGYTQAEMSAIIGVNQSHYSKKERGKQSVTVCELLQLAAWFKIDPLIFFQGARNCRSSTERLERYNSTCHLL